MVLSAAFCSTVVGPNLGSLYVTRRHKEVWKELWEHLEHPNHTHRVSSMRWCLQPHGSKCQWWRRKCHLWFVCLFDICVLRMANSVRALYKPTLQGLPEEMFIVACPHHSFPCAFPHMHHQYQHGSPAFAFWCVGVLSHLSLWVPGNEVFLPSQHPLCLCMKGNAFV